MEFAAKDIHVLEAENTRLYGEIESLTDTLLTTLSKAIAAKDRSTKLHSIRVTEFSLLIGRHMGLPQDEIELLRRGALLHDVGKIGIQDYILLKPGELTEEEFGAIRRHPEIGARILEEAMPLSAVVPIVLHHHERYDGRGYPYGLKGTEIPLPARIVTVSDAFEAMTSNRTYRKALAFDRAIEELRLHAGTQFDPQIVDVCIDALITP